MLTILSLRAFIMRKIFLATLFACFYSFTISAQDDLFGTTKMEARKGLVIALNGSLDFPGADMAKRFGISYRLGPSVFYKTKKNWIIGAKADFIFGAKIVEDSFLANVSSPDGSFIGNDGFRANVPRYERGYLIGLQAGKIINISEKNSDNGILLLTSAGFIQHKILMSTSNVDIAQLKGDYKKGYDRLTNGWFLEQYIGYTYFANDGLINFNIGLDIMAGFTKGRRDFLYDVRKPGTDSRLDMLFGIRGGWYIPVFKRKSEEYFFE